jgi:hypothetical protein
MLQHFLPEKLKQEKPVLTQLTKSLNFMNQIYEKKTSMG